jgi:hypothetical protein
MMQQKIIRIRHNSNKTEDIHVMTQHHYNKGQSRYHSITLQQRTILIQHNMNTTNDNQDSTQ